MKKKKASVIRLTVLLTLGLSIALYLAIGFWYSKGFGPGTYVNGIYCTGKSVPEVNKELMDLYDRQSFVIQDAAGRRYDILLSDVGFLIDYSSQLRRLQTAQNSFGWIWQASDKLQETVTPKISLNEELLRKAVETCGIEQDNVKENIVEIRRQEGMGYILYDGMQDNFNKELACEVIRAALEENRLDIDLSGCYTALPYTAKMLETLKLWEKVNAFQTCGIVYDMGDELLALTPEIVSDFLTLDEDGVFLTDEDGELVFREEGVEEFIEELALTYDTLGSVRSFLSTRGDQITIEGGIYGNKLDRKAELAYLKQAFLEGVAETHKPAYEQEAMVRGREDIGDTYVEIDMTMQMLYYYKEGELLFETEIVTGNTGRRMGTPSGVNYVYNKQRDRVLRGEDYASPVKYWVPVKGNIGIHDASWRNKFGGEIYKTNGSHGCINVPKGVMGELYDMLEIGTPVVMFY